MKRYLTLALSILVVTTLALPIKHATAFPTELHIRSIQISPSEIHPGDTVTISVTFADWGHNALNIRSNLKIGSTDPFTAISPTLVPVGDLGPDEAKTINYYLIVSESAEAKPYPLTLEVTYLGSAPVVSTYQNETHWLWRESVLSSVISIEVKEIKDALLVVRDISVVPSDARPGQEVVINANITNTGEAVARDVRTQLKISTGDPFSPVSQTLLSLGNIDPQGMASVSYSLSVSESAEAKPYTLGIEMTYLNRYHKTVTQKESVGVSVEEIKDALLVVRDISVVPSDARPGQEVKINATIANVGEVVARDVRTRLKTQLEYPFSPTSPTLHSLGDIEPQVEVGLSYSLLVSGSAEAKPYTLEIEISYTDRYHKTVSQGESVGVSIHSITNFRLLNLPSPIVAEQGEWVDVEADLLLIGTGSARFVTVGVAENQTGPFALGSGSEEYIGEVDPDSPVPFVVGFSVKPDATPGDYSLRVEITYWNEYNEVLKTTKEIPVSVVEAIEEAPSRGVAGSFWDLLRIILGVRP
ncbi:MAG: COG1361 S-layer family protein [Candidatus Bathyarchaeia archaeon]